MAKFRMTDRWVQSVRGKPGKKTEHWDAKEENLVLRITPKGYKSWAVRYARRSDGKTRDYTIAPIGDLSLSKARDEAAKIMRRVRLGEDPQADKQNERKTETFNEVADVYLNRHAKPHKRSWQKDEAILNRDIRPMIGDMRVSLIGRQHINTILDNVEDRGNRTQVNRVFEVVRGVFRWAQKRGLIEHDPTSTMVARFKEVPRKRVLSEGEIKSLWHGAANASMGKAIDHIVKLCMITGQRVGEVAGIRMSELDLAKAEWKLPPERTKNGEPHTVPLSGLAMKVIREARADAADSQYLFPSRSRFGHIDPHAVSTAMRRSREVLGLADATVHDLRRTVATGLGELAIPDGVISRCLNHISTINKSITAVYNRHQYEEAKREALDAWARRLNEIVTGGAENVVHLG